MKAKSPWTGEAGRIRRKTMTAINGRIPRGCISDLGRACTDRRGDDRAIAAYAKAMGWPVEDAAAAIERHRAHLLACGQPWRPQAR